MGAGFPRPMGCPDQLTYYLLPYYLLPGGNVPWIDEDS